MLQNSLNMEMFHVQKAHIFPIIVRGKWYLIVPVVTTNHERKNEIQKNYFNDCCNKYEKRVNTCLVLSKFKTSVTPRMRDKGSCVTNTIC